MPSGGWNRGKLKVNAKQGAGGERARKLYPILGKCELCDAEAADRHHVDGNKLNNIRDNLMFLCRHHHMKVDGRLPQFNTNGSLARQRRRRRYCVNCGAPKPPFRHGMCHACNEYLRRNGLNRQTNYLNDGLYSQKCWRCSRMFPGNNLLKRYCPECAKEVLQERWRKNKKRNS